MECEPAGGMKLQVPQDFRAMGERLRKLGRPLLYIAEGGYKLDEVGPAAVAVVSSTRTLPS